MHLLLIAKPSSMTDFLVRFNEYFPHLNKHCDRKSPRLFWSDLSSEEIVQLSKLGVDCCSHVQEVVHWATEHVGKGLVLGFTDENYFLTTCTVKQCMSLSGHRLFKKLSQYTAKTMRC